LGKIIYEQNLEEGEENMEDRFLIEIFKWEAAEELGLLEKVKTVGWSNLSAQETGKIGVLVKRKIKEKMKKRSTV
jgi:hypothetical protein